jgi:hypothetical protein
VISNLTVLQHGQASPWRRQHPRVQDDFPADIEIAADVGTPVAARCRELERARPGDAVDDAVDAAQADVREQVLRVPSRIARQAAWYRDPDAERAERCVVGWHPQVQSFLVGFGLLAEAKPGVCVSAGHPDHPALGRQLVPLVEHETWTIECRRERLARSQRVGQQVAADRLEKLVPPLAVGVQPFEAVDGDRPVLPAQRLAGGPRVRRNAHPAQALRILQHRVRRSGEREW